MNKPAVSLAARPLGFIPVMEDLEHAMWRLQKYGQWRRTIRFIGLTLNTNCAIIHTKRIENGKIKRLTESDDMAGIVENDMR
ncbi:MAG: hypothetical protein OIF58_13435 [Cohaesibacter sp.]|nr:hypothetical protein [Cohaesibacter sp.]